MRARLNDCDILYTSQGSGSPLVLIHGFPVDHTIWTPQTEALSKDHQVVTFDLRGHGKSEATPGVYSMELLAQDMKALLDHLGLDRIVLGGLSMGGYVAFAFLKEYQDAVQGLILADTRAEADTVETRSRREEQALEALQNGAGSLADKLILTMFTPETQERNKALTGRVYEIMRSMSPIGVAGALGGMAQRPDSTAFLSLIRVPTLILVGDQDSTTPLADSQRMADRIVGSQLVIIPRAAHLTSLERPVEVNMALGRFLEQFR